MGFSIFFSILIICVFSSLFLILSVISYLYFFVLFCVPFYFVPLRYLTFMYWIDFFFFLPCGYKNIHSCFFLVLFYFLSYSLRFGEHVEFSSMEGVGLIKRSVILAN